MPGCHMHHYAAPAHTASARQSYASNYSFFLNTFQIVKGIFFELVQDDEN